MREINPYNFSRPYRARCKKVRKIYYGRIILLISVICFSVCAVTLSFALTKKTNFININKQTFYFLQISAYDDIETANNSANINKSRGGAGYLISEKKYILICESFLNEGDAQKELINKRNLGLNATILTYETLNLKVVSGKLNNQIAMFFDYPISAILQLESLKSQLEKKLITSELVNLNIKNIVKNIENYLVNISSKVELYKKEDIHNKKSSNKNDKSNETLNESEVFEFLKAMYAMLLSGVKSAEFLENSYNIMCKLKNMSCQISYNYFKAFGIF